LHCSANERRADEASRDVEAWLKCKYMREHLGEEFSGVVSSVTSFGIFVTLDAMYVEGLVHITELGGEYFRFDELRQELRGERTGMRYALGSRVKVQVSRVDLDGRRIDFRLMLDGEAAALRSTKERGFLREAVDLKGGDDEIEPGRGGPRGLGAVDRVPRGASFKRSANSKASPPANAKDKSRKSRRHS
jgi:ribonuclease R